MGGERRSAHLLRRIQALPLDGRGHWGARWGARRRGRCLGGAGLAGCRSSDRSLGVAPAPPLAPALGRLKDSPRAPFKRQREGERERDRVTPRSPGARSLPAGGPRALAAAAAAVAQDLTFHPGATAARSGSRAVAGSASPTGMVRASPAAQCAPRTSGPGLGSAGRGE